MMNGNVDFAARTYLNSVKIAMVALLEEAEREQYTTAEQLIKSNNDNLEYVTAELEIMKGQEND